MPIPEIFGSDIWDLTPTLNFSIYLFMSTIANEALLENIYDEVWEEFRLQLGLTDDQMYAKEQNGYYTFIVYVNTCK